MEASGRISSSRALSVFFGTEQSTEEAQEEPMELPEGDFQGAKGDDDTEDRILRRLGDGRTESTVQLRSALRTPVMKMAQALEDLSQRQLLRVESAGDHELVSLTNEGLHRAVVSVQPLSKGQ